MSAKIGVQLYSVRDEIDRDLSATLRRVAEAGFDGVETAFFGGDIPLAAAARRIRDLGLEVVAAHTALPLGDAEGDVVRMAEALGCRRVVWHGWPRDDRYGSLDGIRRLADEFNRAGAVAARHGLTLGIHNHWWECEEIDGTFALRVFLAELDPGIVFEFDAYWCRVAGRDPVAVVRELGGRMPLLHLKDGPLARHEPMTALGTGGLDIPPVLAAAGEGLEWAVVELDEVDGDIFAAIAGSRDYLAGLPPRPSSASA